MMKSDFTVKMGTTGNLEFLDARDKDEPVKFRRRERLH